LYIINILLGDIFMLYTFLKSIAIRTFPIVLVFIFSLPFLSCATTENPVTPVVTEKGKVLILSNPSKAKIFINGVSSNYYTGDTLVFTPGKHDITLKVNLFQDTTFSVTAVANQLTVLPTVQLKNSTSIGTLFINSVPQTVKVYVDDKLIGYTGTNIRLNSGTYIVTVKAENYNDTSFSVVILPNQTSVISNINLSLIPTLGLLNINSSPQGADVYINGSYTLSYTATSKYLDAGNYSVTLKKETYKDTTFNVTVVAGQTVERNITLVQNTINITSTPAGATIFVNNINKGITPSVVGLPAGTSTFRLSLSGYWDSTFTVSDQQANQSISVILTPANRSEYIDVKIYESNTNAAVPCGLILSSGRTSFVGSGVSKDSVDIYYRTNGFLVVSARDNIFHLPRETFFKVGSGTLITDGVDSPPKDATWTLSVGDRQTNYFFMYTSDQNYVKMKITGFGGGTGVSNPSYIILRYYFNKTKNDNRF
ncbi:MAG: PEGA domain-containing protein, partial [Ignavibacteriales bacterium]|nr:PEGA domain-containing protein [Ignavibacteriales bacterium]